MLTPLYPIIFQPRLVEKIWGGRKLETVLGKPLPAGKQIGESWELYDFPPGVVDQSAGWTSAAVANGPLAGKSLHELVLSHGKALYGDVPLVGPHGQFPILIKFLDAREDLSVQVHPDAAYAKSHPNAHLKTEAWYVVQHDENARILKGLVDGVTKDDFAAATVVGGVERMIRTVPVTTGDCYYLPSGTVHALGAGVLAAEVQTPSDTTYRLHDFNRIDASTGKLRELHIDQALACIDFTGQVEAQERAGQPAGSKYLVESPFFRIQKKQAKPGETLKMLAGEPTVIVLLEGDLSLAATNAAELSKLKKGQTALLPASLIRPTAKAAAAAAFLEVTLQPNT